MLVDGLPQVNTALMPKLVKFLLKKLCEVGRTNSEAIFMPLNDETEKTEGHAFTLQRPPLMNGLANCVLDMPLWNMKPQSRLWPLARGLMASH